MKKLCSMLLTAALLSALPMYGMHGMMSKLWNNLAIKSVAYGMGAIGCTAVVKKAVDTMPVEVERGYAGNHYAIKDLAKHGVVAGGLSIAALRLGKGSYQMMRQANVWQKNIWSHAQFRDDVLGVAVPTMATGAFTAFGLGNAVADSQPNIINGKYCIRLSDPSSLALAGLFGFGAMRTGKWTYNNARMLKNNTPKYRAEIMEKLANKKTK